MGDIVDLPSPQSLARLVNTATEMLYNSRMTFGGGSASDLPDLGEGHTVMVPLIGAPTYLVTATSIGDGGYQLAGMMFDCSPDSVDDSMVKDSLSELVNILAGQLKGLVAPFHQLGLPSQFTKSQLLNGHVQSTGARVYIGESQAAVDVRVIVFSAMTLDESPVLTPAPSMALRVLVADDDEMVRRLLTAILEAAGMSVVAQAPDGGEAMRLFALELPDVVCLDVNMPGQTGLEVLSSIRSKKPNTVAILISAYNTTDNVLEALRNEADGIISKPFRRENLISEIQRAYARRKITDRKTGT
jgi:two-component system chemotaxis response regulator CheY